VTPASRLARAFFSRSARAVAVDLLGKRLVHRTEDGHRAGGMIVETEAYCDAGEPDLACHGSKNRGRPTDRTAVMFGPPGHAYVYFTYGMHWLFNIVTGDEGRANAVLVRALAPVEGEDLMAARREHRTADGTGATRSPPRLQWTNGPAKLTEALAIDGRHHGADLCDPGSPIWVEDAPPIGTDRVRAGPRVGIASVPEPWRSMPWRYWIADDPFVSPHRQSGGSRLNNS